jgi:hypothetical protein
MVEEKRTYGCSFNNTALLNPISYILFALPDFPSMTAIPFMAGGGGRIRTSEGMADRFTVCSL